MTSIVTGGNGFVGTHLVDHLEAAGEDVVVFDLAEDLMHDVTDQHAVMRVFQHHQPEAVYHLAANPYWAGEEDPAGDLEVNAAGTRNVLEACRSVDARLLFTSTSGVYGNATDASEDHPYRPVSNYGVHKTTAELYVRKTTDVPWRITRFSSVYGPGTYGVVNHFAERALSGEPIEVHGDGSQTRDFIHVSDAVRALTMVMDATGTTHRIYNVGTGVETSVRELADVFTAIAGVDVEHVQHPYADADMTMNSLDIARIRDAVGFDPEITLEDGIQRVLEAESSQ